MSARRRPTAFVDTITAGGKVPEFAHAKPKGKSGMKGARTVAELRAAVDTAEKRRAADMKEIRGELKAIRGLLELRTPNELWAGLAVVGSAGPEIVSLPARSNSRATSSFARSLGTALERARSFYARCSLARRNP
jgi:hypothetical protein